MTVVIQHNWTVAGPGGHYGVVEYQTGPGPFDAHAGVLLVPTNFEVSAPLFIVLAAAVAAASIPTLFTAAFVYARHRHHRRNAALASRSCSKSHAS